MSSFPGGRRRVLRGTGKLLLVQALIVSGCVIFLGVGGSASASSGSPSPSFTRANVLGSNQVPSGASKLGSVPAGQRVSFDVVLAPSHSAELGALMSALYDPSSPDYHQWLKAGQFDQMFGPADSAVQQTESWLRSKGFSSSALDGFAIHVSGTAGQVTSALDVSLDRFRANDGETGFATEGTPLVPTGLADGAIQDIVGLDSFADPEPVMTTSDLKSGKRISDQSSNNARVGSNADGLTPCADATTTATNNGAYTLDQLGADYGIGTLLNRGENAHDETIGVYELASHDDNVPPYLSCFGLHNSVTTVAVDGGGGGVGNGTPEADLDIEDEATQAPQSSIISYEGPNTGSGPYDTWNAIVTADKARVVSSSWGLCEQLSGITAGTPDPYGSMFKQAAAQGQTIVVASGDTGSEACFQSTHSNTSLGVQYPASDPYITSVGGTTRQLSGSEGAWNGCYGQSGDSCALSGNGNGAGGGGVSVDFPRVSGQPAASGITGSAREVPDISANAGAGMVVAYSGFWQVGGGTSFAAPFIAGMVADADNGCATGQGLLSTELYRMYNTYADHGYGVVFNDMTTFGNDYTDTNSGDYPAGTNYDLATGIGTPIAGGLQCPMVTGISNDLADPGTHMTVTGSGLEGAAIYFGNLRAQVLSETSTQADVVVPTGGSSGVLVHASNTVGTGSIGKTFTYFHGYWLVGGDGGVFTFGNAQFYGSTGHLHLQRPVVGITPHADHEGYWLVASDGGVFTFTHGGGFYGSIPGLHIAPYGTTGPGRHLSAPIVGMVPAADGDGYYLVGSDGGVFAFGPGAKFVGSCPGLRGGCSGSAVAVVPDASGEGYWLVTNTGHVYAFGNAHFYGSPGTEGSTVTAAARTEDGNGYWVLFADGQIVPFGDAHQLGEPKGDVNSLDPATALFVTVDGDGYWVASANGSVFAYGDAPNKGGMNGRSLNAPIIAATGW